MHPQEIICLSDNMLEEARTCSQFLTIPIHSEATKNQYLEFKDNTISVISKERKQRTIFTHSFESTAIQRRIQTQDQHLLKAFKDKKKPISTIVDVTAGWCRDSFILAKNNYDVTSIEQSNIVYYLSHYSLKNYLKTHHLKLKLFHDNALSFLKSLTNMPDAIYLDPMFPNTNHQAKNKKEIQVLQAVTENLNINDVFQSSLSKAKQRVVVKRPLHSEFLNELKPNFQYQGKTIRFDVYQCF